MNQSLSSSVLESREIGERYEQIKAEFFREKNRNREIIEGLQERLDDMQRQYDARSVTREVTKVIKVSLNRNTLGYLRAFGVLLSICFSHSEQSK